jgi:hypothetical protein
VTTENLTFEDVSNGVAVTSPYNNWGITGTALGDTTQFKQGSKSVKFASGSTVAQFARGVTAATGRIRVAIRWPSSITANVFLVQIQPTSGTRAVRLYGTTANKLVITDNSSSSGNLWTSTTTFTAGNWYYLNLWIAAGTTGADGQIQATVDTGTITSPTDNSGLLTGKDCGAAGTISSFAFGRMNGTSIGDVWFDDVTIEYPSTGVMPPANVPPSVGITPNQNVAAGSTVNASVTATDSDGTIASYAWTVSYTSGTTPTLTGASTANISFTAPAAGTLVKLQCVVTDNSGGATTATTEVRVPTTGSGIRLLANSATGGTGWTNQGGAANEAAAMSDSSDTTYVESPTFAATADERRWRISPLLAGSAMSLTIRTSLSAVGGVTKARLYEGNTLQQEWTITQGTSPTNQTLTLDSATISAITDWGNLWFAESVST